MNLCEFECALCRYANRYICACLSDTSDFCNENARFESFKQVNTIVFIFKNLDKSSADIREILSNTHTFALEIVFDTINNIFDPPLEHIVDKEHTPGVWLLDNKTLLSYSLDTEDDTTYHGVNICDMCFAQFVLLEKEPMSNRLCINRVMDICDNIGIHIDYGFDINNIIRDIKQLTQILSKNVDEIIEVDIDHNINYDEVSDPGDEETLEDELDPNSLEQEQFDSDFKTNSLNPIPEDEHSNSDSDTEIDGDQVQFLPEADDEDKVVYDSEAAKDLFSTDIQGIMDALKLNK
jgi:hypothetical protein